MNYMNVKKDLSDVHEWNKTWIHFWFWPREDGLLICTPVLANDEDFSSNRSSCQEGLQSVSVNYRQDIRKEGRAWGSFQESRWIRNKWHRTTKALTGVYHLKTPEAFFQVIWEKGPSCWNARWPRTQHLLGLNEVVCWVYMCTAFRSAVLPVHRWCSCRPPLVIEAAAAVLRPPTGPISRIGFPPHSCRRLDGLFLFLMIQYINQLIKHSNLHPVWHQQPPSTCSKSFNSVFPLVPMLMHHCLNL